MKHEELDYTKGCIRFNEKTCDCDLNTGECKAKEYKLEDLLAENERIKQVNIFSQAIIEQLQVRVEQDIQKIDQQQALIQKLVGTLEITANTLDGEYAPLKEEIELAVAKAKDSIHTKAKEFQQSNKKV